MSKNYDSFHSSLKNYLPYPWKRHAQYSIFYRRDFEHSYVEAITLHKGDCVQHTVTFDATIYPIQDFNNTHVDVFHKEFKEAFNHWPQDIEVDLTMEDRSINKFIDVPWQNVATFGWNFILNEQQPLIPYEMPVNRYLWLSKNYIERIREIVVEVGREMKQREKQLETLEVYREAIREYTEEYFFMGWKEVPRGDGVFGYSFLAMDHMNQVVEEIHVNRTDFNYSLYVPLQKYAMTTLNGRLEENPKYKLTQLEKDMDIHSRVVPYDPWGGTEGSIKITWREKIDHVPCSAEAYGFITDVQKRVLLEIVNHAS